MAYAEPSLPRGPPAMESVSEEVSMRVLIVGKSPEKMRAAQAAVAAAGFEVEGSFSESEAMAVIAREPTLFAVVTGGVIDDAAYQRIAAAVPTSCAVLLRTKIGEEDPRAHFEREVVPQLVAARASTARPCRLAIIVGSTRDRRFADVPTAWLQERLVRRPDVESVVLDLRDYPMPFFDHAVAPARKKAPYPNEHVERWTAAIGSADAFVLICAEYNHGYTAVLKNALDWVFREWNRKPVAMVAYGNVGGARAVEQLRQVAVELQMVPVQRAVHLPIEVMLAHARGESNVQHLAALEGRADAMLNELLAWHAVLAPARK
jgi:NAD(P)H-dependent FMN reductase